MSATNCPSCGAPVAAGVSDCRYCGEKITVNIPQVQQPQYQQPQPQYQQPIPPQAPYAPYAQPQPQPYTYASTPSYTKSKVAAGLLALFLGGLGVHKFYLGQIGMGFLYLLLCWTYVPAIIALIEGIIYLSSSDADFDRKYVKH